MFQSGRKVLIAVNDLNLRLRIATPETFHLHDEIHEDNPSGKTLVPDDGRRLSNSPVFSNTRIVSVTQEVSSRATSTNDTTLSGAAAPRSQPSITSAVADACGLQYDQVVPRSAALTSSAVITAVPSRRCRSAAASMIRCITASASPIERPFRPATAQSIV
jgi:hypothetical protein